MVREEAATILYKEWQRFLEHNIDYAGISDAYMMAINTLKQEPCEDSISRQAVMNCFKKWQPYMATRLFGFEKELSSLPPVTPQPKMGHWNTYKLSQGGIDEEWLECSECKWSNALLIPRNYCPRCGCRMKGSDEK